MPGGTWTGAGASPNLLYSQNAGYNGNVGEPSTTPMFSATGYTVTVMDQGPLKTVVKVNYTFNRPQYAYGSTVINTAGTGHYTLIATLYANSKSVLIDEDTDMQFSYHLPLYGQLRPTTARWRGHDALDGGGNPDPICGYEPPLTVTGAGSGTPVVITTSTSGSLTNGQVVLITGVKGNAAANGTLYYAMTTGYSATQFALYQDAALTKPVAATGVYSGGGTVKPVYRGQALVPLSDAWQDLSYNLDRPANYSCTTNSYRKLLADYPVAAHAAGWYVEMYNSAAGATAPVVGFYIGRASKQVYSATGPSLPGIYTSNSDWITHSQAADIQVDTMLRGANGSTACGSTQSLRGGGTPQLGNIREHAGGPAGAVAASADRGRTELADGDQSVPALHISAGLSGSSGRLAAAVSVGCVGQSDSELGPERHGAVRLAHLLRQSAGQFGRFGGGPGAGRDVAGQQRGGGTDGFECGQ